MSHPMLERGHVGGRRLRNQLTWPCGKRQVALDQFNITDQGKFRRFVSSLPRPRYIEEHYVDNGKSGVALLSILNYNEQGRHHVWHGTSGPAIINILEEMLVKNSHDPDMHEFHDKNPGVHCYENPTDCLNPYAIRFSLGCWKNDTDPFTAVLVKLMPKDDPLSVWQMEHVYDEKALKIVEVHLLLGYSFENRGVRIEVMTDQLLKSLQKQFNYLDLLCSGKSSQHQWSQDNIYQDLTRFARLLPASLLRRRDAEVSDLPSSTSSGEDSSGNASTVDEAESGEKIWRLEDSAKNRVSYVAVDVQNMMVRSLDSAAVSSTPDCVISLEAILRMKLLSQTIFGGTI